MAEPRVFKVQNTRYVRHANSSQSVGSALRSAEPALRTTIRSFPRQTEPIRLVPASERPYTGNMALLAFAGTAMRRGRPPISAQQAAIVVLLLPTNYTDRQIGRITGVSTMTVWNIRNGGVRINSEGHAVELGPGQFLAPRPMRCPGCKRLCEQFPCRLCGSCPSVGAIVAVAKAHGLVIEPAPGGKRRRRSAAAPYHGPSLF